MALLKSLCFSTPFFFTFFVSSSHAYTFTVGGNHGWTLHPSENYNNWSSRLRFLVNDTLHFKYDGGSDSVLVVNKSDYDGCNVGNPITKLDGGDSLFELDRSGPFYFVSGNEWRCDQGQKLKVVVLAVRNRSPPPASVAPSLPSTLAPSPSAVTPRSQSSLPPSPSTVTPTSTSSLPPSPVVSPVLPPFKSPVSPPSTSVSPVSPPFKSPVSSPSIPISPVSAPSISKSPVSAPSISESPVFPPSIGVPPESAPTMTPPASSPSEGYADSPGDGSDGGVTADSPRGGSSGGGRSAYAPGGGGRGAGVGAPQPSPAATPPVSGAMIVSFMTIMLAMWTIN